MFPLTRAFLKESLNSSTTQAKIKLMETMFPNSAVKAMI